MDCFTEKLEYCLWGGGNLLPMVL